MEQNTRENKNKKKKPSDIFADSLFDPSIAKRIARLPVGDEARGLDLNRARTDNQAATEDQKTPTKTFRRQLAALVSPALNKLGRRQASADVTTPFPTLVSPTSPDPYIQSIIDSMERIKPANKAFLDPASAASRSKAQQDAHDHENAIHERLRRKGEPIPEFVFRELIGKGSFGRVFKAYDKQRKCDVALKIINVDDHDYQTSTEEKDETVTVARQEISILQQLKNFKTKNVNMILDVFDVHSQLWIVSEYCPGGSVRTLMTATNGKLEDKFIVPIARELAEGLKAIHEAGIIHRDVKAANIMIHEKGKLQIIDFGVSGELQSINDKRSTIIGTPHWMAPEMHKRLPVEGLRYGIEVDVWAYGCTLFEITSGLPPYARTAPGRILGSQLARAPPRLSNELECSQTLRDLVAFVLEAQPSDRPSMAAILNHQYVLATEQTHPTESLTELVKAFYQWEFSGGKRQSLFAQGGAAPLEYPGTAEDNEGWNFSTTDDFANQFLHTATEPTSLANLDDPNNTLQASHTDTATNSFDDYQSQPEAYTPASPECWFNTAEHDVDNTTATGNLTPLDKARAEESVKRGEQSLQGLFDEDQAPYKYDVRGESQPQKPPVSRSRSDLPLRNETGESSIHRKELIADDSSASFMELPNIDLADASTIKAGRAMKQFLGDLDQDDDSYGGYQYGAQADTDKRATKDWTFPKPDVVVTNTDDAAADSLEKEPNKRDTTAWKFPASAMMPATSALDDDPTPMAVRPALRHTATAPVGDARQSMGSVLDLDELYDSDLYASDALGTAPASDDEAPSHMEAFELVAPAPAADANHQIALDTPGQSGGSTNASTDSEDADDDDDDDDEDPFLHHLPSIEGMKKNTNALLDRNGVTDVLECAVWRREYLNSAKELPNSVKKDMDDKGFAEFKERRWISAEGPDGQNNPNVWTKYSHLTNLAPATTSYPMGSPTRLNDPDFLLSTGLRSTPTHIPPTTTTRADNRIRDRTGTIVTENQAPMPAPPSAAAMQQNAPASVVEGELTRVLTEWTSTIGTLGDFFDGLIVGAGSRRISAGDRGRGLDGPADDERQEEEGFEGGDGDDEEMNGGPR